MDQSEQNIWQRVFSQEPPRRQDLRPLVLEAMEQATVFRHLANSLTGSGKELARALHRGQMETVSCLRGLELLSGSTGPVPKQPPEPKSGGKRLLEQAFFRSRRAAGEYTARSLDSDFGGVFRQLARQEELRGGEIARLLGTGMG